jgi:hypothetical protein
VDVPFILSIPLREHAEEYFISRFVRENSIGTKTPGPKILSLFTQWNIQNKGNTHMQKVLKNKIFVPCSSDLVSQL